MDPLDARIAAEAERHFGVIDLVGLRELGASTKAIKVRVARGNLIRLYRGVFAVAGVPLGTIARMTAAWMATGRQGVVGGTAAALIWNLDGYDDEAPLFVIPTKVRLKGWESNFFRSEMASGDVRWLRGLPVTNVERMISDLAALVPIWRVENAIECVLFNRLSTYARIREKAIELRAPGRKGCGRLVELLKSRDPDAAATESLLETRFHRLLRKGDLPRFVTQQRIFDRDGFVGRPDLYFPDSGLVVECLGARFHYGKRRTHKDARRHNRLEALGNRVLYFTKEDADRRPRRLFEEVRAVLAQLVPPTSGLPGPS